MEERINVAVIGLGWVATQRHIPIISQNPSLCLYGAIDKHAERLTNLQKTYPFVKISHSSDGEMPWSDNIQAVLIATDPLNHYHLAKKMILHGKHVLMEKPLTMTLSEGMELKELAEQQKVSLCVVHNFQFARSTRKLKDMIVRGEIGEILNIEAIQFSNPNRRLPTWYEQLPYGLYYDESPHMFYMLEALAGREIKYISSAILRKPGKNTPVTLTGQYRAGSVPLRLCMNFDAALSEWQVIVMGSRKIGIIDIFRDILVTIPNDGLHRAREILTTSSAATLTHWWGFLTSGLLLARKRLYYGADIVWQKFVRQIKDGTQADGISVNNGLRIVQMQHEIIDHSIVHEIGT